MKSRRGKYKKSGERGDEKGGGGSIDWRDEKSGGKRQKSGQIRR